MSFKFSESVVEDASLDWLDGLGYSVVPGPEITPGELLAERAGFDTAVLEKRLRSALTKLKELMERELERINPSAAGSLRE